MATMIPAAFPPTPLDATPVERSGHDGERIVYNLLREAPEEWTVIYDLMPRAVEDSNSTPRQIDFLVIVPKKGILILEVKNGIWELREGRWYPAGREDENAEEDPERQARSAMDALRSQLRARFGGNAMEARFPYGYTAVLVNPASSEPPQGGSAIKLNQDPLAEHFVARLNALAERTREDRVTRTRGRAITLQPKRLRRLLDFLAPSSPVIPTASPELQKMRQGQDEIEQKLVELTRDQLEVLQTAKDNPRVRYEGAAGTGKTVAAVELAQRHYEAGERVALVCLSRLLGEWMCDFLKDEIDQPSQAGGTLTVGRFWNDFARPAIEADDRRSRSFRRDMNRSDSDAVRFGEIFPRYARQAFRMSRQFDYIIVDEFQDLCREPFLEILDVALKGGLLSGNWAVFGDFENQALHEAFNPRDGQSEEESDLEANLERYIGDDAVERTLAVNCRNTPPIVGAFSRMSGTPRPEVSEERWLGVSLEKPRYRYWEDSTQLEALLEEEVKGLIAKGWEYDKIVVLSGRRLENLGIDHRRSYGPWQPKERRSYEEEQGGPSLWFCTVDSFKGLESQVVILILEGTRSPRDRGIAYVGGSRAKQELITLAHRRTRRYIAEEDSGPPGLSPEA